MGVVESWEVPRNGVDRFESPLRQPATVKEPQPIVAVPSPRTQRSQHHVNQNHAKLLFDSVAANTGDEAIGIASQQIFERLGLGSVVVSPFASTMPSPLVIGGGELIRTMGDSFYDAYRQHGNHILNAAGVWKSADSLDYLNGYQFVSARSATEAEILSRSVREVRVVPCGTTLLESPDIEVPGLEDDEPVVGLHLVPHSLRMVEDLVEIVDALPFRKVLIPFTHYNRDASFMEHLPFSKSQVIHLGQMSPLELHAVFRRMKMVIVTSLHASIFAYSQNIPFVSIHQKKVDFYFRDRGLELQIPSDGASLREAVQRTLVEPPDVRERVAVDRVKVEDAFRSYVKLLGETPQFDLVDNDDHSSATAELLLNQSSHVIRDRDLAIGYLERRRAQLLIALKEKDAELADFWQKSGPMKRMSIRYVKEPRRRFAKFIAKVRRRLSRPAN